ncbi:hypothetical protein [Williamsia soli]|uniref:hypothetical protein n=1 Tax=Williamsia soli TaxID=364929 RepID=UPI001F1693BD|nr:hypothetical protein [Williamsia soli]
MSTTEISPAATGDLSILPPAQPMKPGSLNQLMQHAEAMDVAHRLADRMCRTTVVPEIYQVGSYLNRDKDDEVVTGNATAAILYGMEIGLAPIQALQQVFSVGGRPAIYARTAVALLTSRGYKIWTEDSSDESVTVMAQAPDGRAEGSTWSVDRATKAGYVPTIDEKTGDYRKNQRGKLIGNEKYLTDPQAMLYAKAAMEVCRKIAPDVLMGIADGDDAAVVDEAPRKVANEAASSQAIGVEQLRAKMGLQSLPAPSDSGVKQDTPQAKPPAKPTKKQAEDLDRLFADANIETDNWSARYVVINRTINRAEPVTDIRTLTRDEVADLITTLGGLQAEGVLVETVENMLIEEAQAKEAQS